ncbi:MAG: hypothetical protein ABH821_05940 [archaeon]
MKKILIILIAVVLLVATVNAFSSISPNSFKNPIQTSIQKIIPVQTVTSVSEAPKIDSNNTKVLPIDFFCNDISFYFSPYTLNLADNNYSTIEGYFRNYSNFDLNVSNFSVDFNTPIFLNDLQLESPDQMHPHSSYLITVSGTTIDITVDEISSLMTVSATVENNNGVTCEIEGLFPVRVYDNSLDICKDMSLITFNQSLTGGEDFNVLLGYVNNGTDYSFNITDYNQVLSKPIFESYELEISNYNIVDGSYSTLYLPGKTYDVEQEKTAELTTTINGKLSNGQTCNLEYSSIITVEPSENPCNDLYYNLYGDNLVEFLSGENFNEIVGWISNSGDQNFTITQQSIDLNQEIFEYYDTSLDRNVLQPPYGYTHQRITGKAKVFDVNTSSLATGTITGRFEDGTVCTLQDTTTFTVGVIEDQNSCDDLYFHQYTTSIQGGDDFNVQVGNIYNITGQKYTINDFNVVLSQPLFEYYDSMFTPFHNYNRYSEQYLWGKALIFDENTSAELTTTVYGELEDGTQCILEDSATVTIEPRLNPCDDLSFETFDLTLLSGQYFNNFYGKLYNDSNKNFYITDYNLSETAALFDFRDLQISNYNVVQGESSNEFLWGKTLELPFERTGNLQTKIFGEFENGTTCVIEDTSQVRVIPE